MICYVFLYFCYKESVMKSITNPEVTTEVNQILVEIGSRIRAKRKLLANNYEDFAKAHHFNKVTISRIENGENVTISTLIEVAKAVDLPLENLFAGIR